MVDKRNVKAPPASPAYPEFGRIVDAKIPRIGSNAKVASAIGVTPEMVRRYRLGIAMPRDRELEKLAALIGMKAADLRFPDRSGKKKAAAPRVTADEMDMISEYRQLPDVARKAARVHIVELLEQFGKPGKDNPFGKGTN